MRGLAFIDGTVVRRSSVAAFLQVRVPPSAGGVAGPSVAAASGNTIAPPSGASSLAEELPHPPATAAAHASVAAAALSMAIRFRSLDMGFPLDVRPASAPRAY